MKKLLFFGLFLTSVLCFGQVPQGISYQAIALDGSGNPIVSLPVGIRLSILDSSASGTVLYTETHTPTTNAQGLYNLVIGQGTPTTGTFSTINWGTNSKFLKVEIDAAGGTNYVLVGSTQLLSVPYALYAEKIGHESIIGGPDISAYIDDTYTDSFITDTHAYAFNSNDSSGWMSTPIIGTPFKKSKYSFLTSTSFYIYGEETNNAGQAIWISHPINGQPKDLKSNDAITSVITTTNAYVHYRDSNGILQWSNTAITGEYKQLSQANQGQALGVLTSANAYVFVNDAWQSTPISGVPLKVKYVGNNGLFFLTSTNAYIYYINPDLTTYSWHTIPYSGNLMLD